MKPVVYLSPEWFARKRAIAAQARGAYAAILVITGIVRTREMAHAHARQLYPGD